MAIGAAVAGSVSLGGSARALNDKYQAGFKCLAVGEACPPCPACSGKMIPWDAWLVTGATCESCGWNMSEGSGCLL